MQHDRYKERDVQIDFKPHVDFQNMTTNCLQLIFITNGSLTANLNQRPVSLKAPVILFLTPHDTWELTDSRQPAAQAFQFQSDFLKTVPYSKYQEYHIKTPELMNGLSRFTAKESRLKIFHLQRALFEKLHQFFFILGTEVFAQSDHLWVCRIKKYLIQILKVLEDLNREHVTSSVDNVLDYIYTNYDTKITLADLVNVAHLNRVSLNRQFNERVNMTAMTYLAHYRLAVADQLLIHTGMSLADIAAAVGYDYETYFIKQFQKQRGVSPTAFRLNSRELATII
ncbi:AraC family transcriptional regulator [Lactiplantibacillus garii]|uniref:AraC family transcriptional regulator n=1 Tax=Lactiplantibacillus garii TaxID=2306423 RepID=A0A426D7W1_9LACO|nr:AraC family transcriptional regulator [Lactiplantibacillus garii]RRK10680.1 AraC family transcriptional regulator [Lactiplantibacillus garii]